MKSNVQLAVPERYFKKKKKKKDSISSKIFMHFFIHPNLAQTQILKLNLIPNLILTLTLTQILILFR